LFFPLCHCHQVSLREQPTSREVASCALAKRRLSNERRNSILMTRHYPDLGSASYWLKRAGTSFQPIRSTTKIWVVTRHQYGISALVTQTSLCEGSSGDLAKCRLFSQAITRSQAYQMPNFLTRSNLLCHNIYLTRVFRADLLGLFRVVCDNDGR